MELLLNSIALEPNRWTEEKEPHFELIELLEAIVAHGFLEIEVWQNHISRLSPQQFGDLQSLAQDLGVAFPILGLYPELHHAGDRGVEERQEMIRLLDRAAELGSRVVKIFVGSIASGDLSHEGVRHSLDALSAICEAAAERQLLVTGETHANTLFDTVASTRAVIEELETDVLHVCFQPLDNTDTDKAGKDFIALADQVIHVHLQGRSNQRISLLEEADIDYERLLKIIDEAGFDGFYSIEFVKDCVVDRPEDFDLQLVLSNAVRDRDFVRGVLPA